MKYLPLFVLLFSALYAVGDAKRSDFVLVIKDDIKQAPEDRLRDHEELQANAKTEQDRRMLKRNSQRLYEMRLDDVVRPYWEKSILKKNEDWRKVWSSRIDHALAEARAKRLDADSLARAFPKVMEFEGGGDAMIPVRVLLAKFGEEKVWVVLVHWERADSVERAVRQEDEVDVGHILAMAFRTTDLELVTLTFCE